jgi:diacylglycerol kinase family enzyme
MIIVLNTHAGGGKAAERWQSIRYRLPLPPWTRVVIMDGPDRLGALIQEATAAGERDFVAAGGDGTIHAVLNALLTALPGNLAHECRLGAIGLGSSNDFHKPIRSWQCRGGIPYRLDFARATFRDVGLATLDPDSCARRRWFLINASVGITADANAVFNSDNRALLFLKRRSTPLAIVYAAVRTILLSHNMDTSLRIGARESSRIRLSNLAVVKNPHISGSLSFGGVPVYDSGTFRVYISRNLGIGGRLRLLANLAQGCFPDGIRHTSRTTRDLLVCAEAPFAVETDGEVATASSVQFSVFPHYLQVCP